jgi:hypothetical protein
MIIREERKSIHFISNEEIHPTTLSCNADGSSNSEKVFYDVFPLIDK